MLFDSARSTDAGIRECRPLETNVIKNTRPPGSMIICIYLYSPVTDKTYRFMH